MKSKTWSTPYFKVRRGFKSDTLSPLIFLLATNPVLIALQTMSFTERLNLNNVEWQLAWKREKPFYPTDILPPYRPVPTIRRILCHPKYTPSSKHRVKGYADDLVTTTSAKDLQDTLDQTDKHCSSTRLEVRPDKCASFSKPGKRVLCSTQFVLPLFQT